ncbi:MAG: tetratricopeptide repeat protein [Cohaesibacteraceae bacterium]
MMTLSTSVRLGVPVLLAGGLLAGMMTPALAQKGAPSIEICTDSDAQAANRIQACNAAIPSLSGDELADATYGLGRALRDEERYEESLAAFNSSLEARPDDAQTYRSRSVAFRELDRRAEELADLDEALRLEPDNEWAHYWRGHVHYDLGDMETALVDFEAAARLEADDYHNQFWLGRTQQKLGRLDEAVESLTLAHAERPFRHSPSFARAFAHAELGHLEDAVRDFRVAMLLDPNQQGLQGNINDLIGDIGTIDALPDYTCDPSRLPSEATNLTVLLPQETQSEREAAIGELANWFRAPRRATPEAGTWTRETFDLTEDGDVVSSIMVEERFEVPESLPDHIVRHTDRGVILTLNRDGEEGPGLISRPDDPQALDAIWSLQVGYAVTGSGTYRTLCPPDWGLTSVLMGCGDNDSVEAGTYTFEAEVMRVERVGVPAGTYDAFVVRYRELGNVRQMGNERERVQEFTWWVAPEAGTWVRRTSLQDDKVATQERVTITP